MGTTLRKPIMTKLVQRTGSKHLAVASCSISGYRDSMEDAHCMIIEDKYTLFGIFDGHNNEKCSQYIASNLPKMIKSQEYPITDEKIESICNTLDDEYIKLDHEGGSTATFVIIENKRNSAGKYNAIIANVGDSRTMVIRDREIVFVTEDHKPKNQKEKQRIEVWGGRISSDNRVDGLAMSRAFGNGIIKNKWVRDMKGEYIYLETNVKSQNVIPSPDITRLELSRNDIVLLACDGVFEGEFPNKDVAAYVVSLFPPFGGDYAVVGSKLCDKAVSMGSKDNISCIVVHMTDGREFVSKFPPASFIPGPPYENDEKDDYFYAKESISAYIQMAERGGSSLVDTLKRRYELYTAYINNKLDSLPLIEQVAFDTYTKKDAEREAKFWGKGPRCPDDIEYFKALTEFKKNNDSLSE